jgi:hypothetical protein
MQQAYYMYRLDDVEERKRVADDCKEILSVIDLSTLTDPAPSPPPLLYRGVAEPTQTDEWVFQNGLFADFFTHSVVTTDYDNDIMLSVVAAKWHHTVVTRPEWVRGALLNYKDVFADEPEWIANSVMYNLYTNQNHGPNNTSLKVSLTRNHDIAERFATGGGHGGKIYHCDPAAKTRLIFFERVDGSGYDEEEVDVSCRVPGHEIVKVEHLDTGEIVWNRKYTGHC